MRRSVEGLRARLPSPAPAAPSRPEATPPPAAESFEWAIVGHYVLLVVHSIGRHKALLVAVWFSTVALSLGMMAVLPKTYEVMTTLQAQRSQLIPALGGTPDSADAPTKQAAETVLSHDNLVALVRQTELIQKWPLNRAPLMKLKDTLYAHLFAPPSEESQIEGFVGLLEKRLWVSTGEGTVTIGVRFPDPQLAFQLVETAVQNFLEARHAAEISSIADVISLLETHAIQAQDGLQEALRQLQQLREARIAKLGKNVRPAAVPKKLGPDQVTSQLMVQAEAKRRAISDLESFRRRRIAELETKLEELRALYSGTHPAVGDVQQSLVALRQESPQLATLRKELEPLEVELKRRGFAADAKVTSSRPGDIALQVVGLDVGDPHEDEDADIDYAKSQVRHAVARYNTMLDRVETVQLEQDTAQAAFKYRYVVIWPAQKPRGSVQPNPFLVLLASLVAGLVLAIVGTALVDISSRKIVEPWQLERATGLPLLAELRLR
jgi:uncharacterized protein involved in exopolysaccharide biosynthesis